MSIRDITRFAACYLLLACLLAIHVFPFASTVNTPYQTVFMAWSGILAAICLVLAWGLLADAGRWKRRWPWCALGLVAALLATMRLLPGKWTHEHLGASISLGIAGTVPAVVAMAGWFWWRRSRTGYVLTFASALASEDEAGQPVRRYRLRKLFALTAACAFLSLQLRLTVQAPDGWLAAPPDAGVVILAVIESLWLGLLAAPFASLLLRPTRLAFLYPVYFLVVVAVQPWGEALLTGWFTRPVGLAADERVWPEFYSALIVDNITWYGPQLLPTLGLFVLLRLAGGHMEPGYS